MGIETNHTDTDFVNRVRAFGVSHNKFVPSNLSTVTFFLFDGKICFETTQQADNVYKFNKTQF